MVDITTIIGEGAFDGTVRNQINANFTALNTGGGGSILHQIAVTLDDAAIIAVPASRPTLIDEPGSDLMIIPVTALAIIDKTAGDYASDDSPPIWLFKWGETVAYASNAIGAAGFITAGVPVKASVVSQPFFGIGNGDYAGYRFTPDLDLTALSDLPLTLVDDANDGLNPYTGGGTGNTAKFFITYVILNTATGVYE